MSRRATLVQNGNIIAAAILGFVFTIEYGWWYLVGLTLVATVGMVVLTFLTWRRPEDGRPALEPRPNANPRTRRIRRRFFIFAGGLLAPAAIVGAPFAWDVSPNSGVVFVGSLSLMAMDCALAIIKIARETDPPQVGSETAA